MPWIFSLKTHMDGSKPCTTPLGTQKLDHSGTPLSSPHEYRSIVGALQYLTWTRPDLSFAVNQLCQFLHCSRDTHFQSVKRVLRFLKGTVNDGLWFRKAQSISLPSRMLIGQVVSLIDALQVVTVSILVITSSVGVLRSNTQLLVPPLKLSTVLWLIPLPSLPGSAKFSKIYTFQYLRFQLFGVIMCLRSPLLPILFFMLERNTLR